MNNNINNTTVANKTICLSLNKLWQPIGYKTVKDAIISMCGSDEINLALDIEYAMKEDGTPDFDSPISMIPTPWEKWVYLPVRAWDFSISSAKLTIRVPTVLIATNFAKMPVKEFKGKPSKDAIFQRDGGICQYTKQKLSRDEASVDHVIPKFHGGRDTWENMVTCKKDLNSKKGSSRNEEIGLRLIKKPVAPLPVPVMYLIREIKHPDWNSFLKNN